MGTPQTIVYGVPCHCESWYGLLMLDQLVASMKSMAYLMELDEPSQLAAVSMPFELESPSYRPSPAASVDEFEPLLEQTPPLALVALVDDVHAAVTMMIPAITRVVRT